MKYKTKDGRTIYTLPKCKICKKSSNTTDKETSQMAFRYGRICRACTKHTNESFDLGNNNKQSLWETIKSWFK